MFPFLDPLQPTALPALFFLLWLPIFLALRPQHSRIFFICAGAITLVFVAGPPLALGLAFIIFSAYGLIELVARLRHRLVPAGLLLVGLHAGYWACFHLLIPGGYASLNPDQAAGVFLFFSGIGLTFIRVLSYFWDRVRLRVAPLSFRDYLAYMLFFPQFRHGPLERAHAFAAHLAAARQHWTRADVRAGALRITVGLLLALGVVQALRFQLRHVNGSTVLREISDSFGHPELLTFPQLLAVIHLPAIGLYLFESAAAHLQLGVSRVFGVHGSENYNYPLLSTSPAMVWQRWNITLSHWLRDYVYVPLTRQVHWRYANLVVVFAYCGLLHGLQLNFLLWGLWTGSSLALYHWWKHRRPRTPVPARPRPWPLAALRKTLACLATFHWFCLSGMIFVDARYCGLRILREYLYRLVSWTM